MIRKGLENIDKKGFGTDYEAWTWDTNTAQTQTRRLDKSLKCKIRGHDDIVLCMCVSIYIFIE